MNTNLRTLAGLVPAGLSAPALAGCDATTADTALAPTAASLSLSGDECRGTVGAISVEKIIVPDDASCTLNGTRFASKVEVKAGARFTATGATIGSDIQADNAASVTVTQSTVGGNMQLKQGGSAAVRTTCINGDLQFEQNRGALVAARNQVGANLHAFGNMGGLTLTANTIAQNLQCKENAPAPRGSGNRAGKKEDQCAAL